jgi:hypothetical protein
MRTLLSVAAFAVAAALLSSAAVAGGEAPAAVDAVAPVPAIDLGVDVTGVSRTHAAVEGYLAGLGPVDRDALLQACDAYSYTLDPKTDADRKTLAFCGIALGV